MKEFCKVEIDLDVHRVIEAGRKSFSESPNDVLRRLLKIDHQPVIESDSYLVSGKAWSGKGVTLPHGTELKMEYNGVQSHGRIEDGKWIAGGASHAGPSPAAAAVAKTKDGNTPSLNGWVYWHAKLPGTSRWKKICDMRGS